MTGNGMRTLSIIRWRHGDAMKKVLQVRSSNVRGSSIDESSFNLISKTIIRSKMTNTFVGRPDYTGSGEMGNVVFGVAFARKL